MSKKTAHDLKTRNEFTSDYPPVEHFMRDCGQWIEWDGENYTAGMPATPYVCAEPGGVRLGIWASLADLIGGAVATRAVRPDWIATSDMTVHLFSPLHEGELRVVARLLRQGRRTVIIEVDLLGAEADQTPIGMATLGFSVLKARGPIQQMKSGDEPNRTDFAHADKALDRDILTRLGAEALDPAEGRIRLETSAYSSNTLGATQGGVLALLADEAGQLLGRARGQAQWVTRDMTLHYLALGRTGPLETRARLLHPGPESALVRVEILDRGESDRRVLAATLRVGEIQSSHGVTHPEQVPGVPSPNSGA